MEGPRRLVQPGPPIARDTDRKTLTCYVGTAKWKYPNRAKYIPILQEFTKQIPPQVDKSVQKDFAIITTPGNNSTTTYMSV
ncbi:hypothetical protein PDE_06901 [Penicillium oxalicum 114-2]|uniref:Uncharacterized protein n=1 Tax=Penicillium oxalicum (strain 114-2 / CGMCC 5302) TaxID=933388 RepID=S8BAU4_PENO1|nr:hypothetical protein PDE_06901 [Penicillium oxalicum 114-2]